MALGLIPVMIIILLSIKRHDQRHECHARPGDGKAREAPVPAGSCPVPPQRVWISCGSPSPPRPGREMTWTLPLCCACARARTSCCPSRARRRFRPGRAARAHQSRRRCQWRRALPCQAAAAAPPGLGPWLSAADCTRRLALAWPFYGLASRPATCALPGPSCASRLPPSRVVSPRTPRACFTPPRAATRPPCTSPARRAPWAGSTRRRPRRRRPVALPLPGSLRATHTALARTPVPVRPPAHLPTCRSCVRARQQRPFAPLHPPRLPCLALVLHAFCPPSHVAVREKRHSSWCYTPLLLRVE